MWISCTEVTADPLKIDSFAAEFSSESHAAHKLSRQKIALARLFTDFGYDIVMSDVDVVWFKDPFPYFSR